MNEFREISCTRKKPYPTEEKARRALVGLLLHEIGNRRDKSAQRLHVYKCDFGKHYHLGHEKQEEE